MLLENFWDDANVALNDSSWAMCSLKFDTSQVSLRLVYLWLYMKQEFPPDEHPIGVRRAVYASLVNAFFKDKAPIDVPDYDKHSTNFKCLILAWYNELITGCQDLDTKLDDLAASNSMNMAADFIDTFLRVVQPDDDWMLRAQTLSNAWDEGKISQRSGAKRAKRTAKDDDGIAFATNEEMEDYFANDGVEEDDEDEDEDNDEDEDDLDPNNPATNGNTLYIGKPRRRKNVDEDYDPEEGATDDEEDDERSSDSRNDGGYRAPRQKAIQTPKRRGQVGRPPTKTRGRGRPPLARSSSRHAVKLEPTNQDEAPRRGPGRPPKSRTVYYRPTGRQNGFDDDDDDDDGNEIQRQYDDEEDTLEDEIESKPPPRKKGRSGPRGRGRGRRDEYDDDVGGASYQSLQRRRGYQVGRR